MKENNIILTSSELNTPTTQVLKVTYEKFSSFLKVNFSFSTDSCKH